MYATLGVRSPRFISSGQATRCSEQFGIDFDEDEAKGWNADAVEAHVDLNGRPLYDLSVTQGRIDVVSEANEGAETEDTNNSVAA
jgi:hypothetical protein